MGILGNLHLKCMEIKKKEEEEKRKYKSFVLKKLHLSSEYQAN